MIEDSSTHHVEHYPLRSLIGTERNTVACSEARSASRGQVSVNSSATNRGTVPISPERKGSRIMSRTVRVYGLGLLPTPLQISRSTLENVGVRVESMVIAKVPIANKQKALERHTLGERKRRNYA